MKKGNSISGLLLSEFLDLCKMRDEVSDGMPTLQWKELVLDYRRYYDQVVRKEG